MNSSKNSNNVFRQARFGCRPTEGSAAGFPLQKTLVLEKRGYIGVYRGYIGIMEKNLESAI